MDIKIQPVIGFSAKMKWKPRNDITKKCHIFYFLFFIFSMLSMSSRLPAPI